MSLVNILMTRDRAFVATDTLAMQGDFLTVVTRMLGPPVRHPKLLALPHARCVIAWRSNQPEAIDGLRLGLLQDFDSFDHGLTDLPERLTLNLEAEALRQGYASLAEVEADSPLLSQQLFMVGWSEGEQCMALLMLHFQDGKLRRQVAFGPRVGLTRCLSCADGERVNELPADAYAMGALTHAIVGQARAADSLGAKGVGGTLVVAEITQESVNLVHCGDLGLPPYSRVGQDLERRAESMQLQIATVPQVATEGIAPGAVAPIATATSGGSSVYLTEVTIVSTTIDSQGYPIYVSLSVDANGSYSGDKATFRVKLDGVTQYTKDIASTRDGSQPGNPWFVKGALVQTVITSPGTGTKTIDITAIGTHATYGVTVENANLYCEGKLR